MRNLFIILLLFPILTIINAQNVNREIRKGNKDYKKGDFENSGLHYRKALEKNPESDDANYNLGNALYKQNQFEPAIAKYEALTGKVTDPSKLSTYYYNLGNSYFKSQKLDKCIEAYKQSLRLNPKDADTKYNLTLAQRMQKQQQNQQSQDNKNKDQKNKENQKKDQDKQQEQKDQQKQDQKDQQKPDEKQQISKQDAERLLEAMEQDEKNVMKKVQEQKAQVRKIPVEKEW
jgi:Ca-activated chloride channel homolog